jgi:hypothetical protein
MTTIKPSIEVVLRKEASQGSNNKKKYVAGFGLSSLFSLSLSFLFFLEILIFRMYN